MSSTRVYESSSGDTWDLVHDDATEALRVRHTPNLASGGQSSETPLDAFLRIAPHSAEHQAIVAHLKAETDKGRPRIRGYIHDPKEPDGPYIAVVLDANSEPLVTLHRSYAEAERELESKLAVQRQTTLSHQARDADRN